MDTKKGWQSLVFSDCKEGDSEFESFVINFYIFIFSWTIMHLIVSIRKFLIVIGSPRAYLSRNRRAITWVSNYRCPIWTLCKWIPVIGYPSDLHANNARFKGFFSRCFTQSKIESASPNLQRKSTYYVFLSIWWQTVDHNEIIFSFCDTEVGLFHFTVIWV